MVRTHMVDENMQHDDWLSALDDEGIDVLLVRHQADMESLDVGTLPHLAFLDFTSLLRIDTKPFIEQCSSFNLPVIALLTRSMLPHFDLRLGASDFLVCPPQTDEVIARVKQTLHRVRSEQPDDVIRAGSLIINPSTYEVSLRGKRINLRFKEYELLRLLATNPGRVYSREVLLSSVWGYDYFGGTRTVDVHIRRLRSKIEDAEQPYIETIWNVGYRFRDFSQQD